ncbi:MAG: hypothetical protein IJ688_06650 [Treponema sp.]|nr:hypothetical protein [Treponema sp.]
MKKEGRNLILAAIGMVLFMIGDWLLDAAGAGDAEVGLVVHSNWVNMASWRFVASAVLALVAIFPVWLGVKEAIKISADSTRLDSGASRFWNKAFQWGQVILIAFGMGFHIILCMFPIFFKQTLAAGASVEFATAVVNDSASLVVVPLIILYILCDAGISIAWYYIILKKELNLGKWALFCCPLSSLIIDFILKAIPLQFFKDFTVAFESLGWLLMYTALAVHCFRKKD